MATRADSIPLGLRISPVADQLLKQIAGHMGVSKTAVLEIVIREKAKHEGIPMPVADSEKTVIPDGGARSAADVYAMAARIAALGETAILGPGADSREAIYGERG